MTSPDHVDVYPDEVMRAGRATDATAANWRSWGNRIATSLRHSESSVKSTKIFAEIEAYAEQVVPAATRVGDQVGNLGVNTTSAGAVVENGDVEAAGVVNQHGGAVVQQTSLLSRQVNGFATPV